MALPLKSSDQPVPLKRHELNYAKLRSAEIDGKSLKLTATGDKQAGKDNVIEKPATKDKLICKDKLIKAPYIPKWAYILIALNVVFATRKLKRFLSFRGSRALIWGGFIIKSPSRFKEGLKTYLTTYLKFPNHNVALILVETHIIQIGVHIGY